jgi:hypothetical protein
MTHFTDTRYTKEAAKAIINALYEADITSSFVGKKHQRLQGANITASITVGSNGWSINAKSSTWELPTIRSIVYAALDNMELMSPWKIDNPIS